MENFGSAGLVTVGHPELGTRTVLDVASGRTRVHSLDVSDGGVTFRRSTSAPALPASDEKIIYAGAIGYKLVKRKDGFSKLEKMTDADYRASGTQPRQKTTVASAGSAREAALERSIAESEKRQAAIQSKLDDLKRQLAEQDPGGYLASDESSPEKLRQLEQARRTLMQQAGGATVSMSGDWQHENPAISAIRKDLERQGDSRSPEQFLRDLIQSNDKAAVAKADELRQAREKLLRQVGGAKD